MKPIVIIDGRGQTSAPDIYAVGDCTEYTVDEQGNTCTQPYIAPLMTAARVIAKTLAGQPALIDLKPAPVIVKTPSFPLALVPPPPHAKGVWRDTRSGTHIVSRYYDASGVMVGFGMAPHDTSMRQGLLAELGGKALDAA